MTVYYNEIDHAAVVWLEALIKEKLIPYGHVDDRDIRDVRPNDLRGFSQCHFFAGIGGWPLALRLAGLDDRRSTRNLDRIMPLPTFLLGRLWKGVC